MIPPVPVYDRRERVARFAGRIADWGGAEASRRVSRWLRQGCGPGIAKDGGWRRFPVGATAGQRRREVIGVSMEFPTGAPSGRNRVRPVLGAVEGLEARPLLAYSPLGFSLPNLTIQGAASTAAAWGGQVTITATVDNLGSSTLDEPLALDPNVGSSADAAATTAAVYASKFPNSLKGAVLVGELSIPAVSENDFVQTTQTITLPSQPLGFPWPGGQGLPDPPGELDGQRL